MDVRGKSLLKIFKIIRTCENIFIQLHTTQISELFLITNLNEQKNYVVKNNILFSIFDLHLLIII
jgi:hypothetical protein